MVLAGSLACTTAEPAEPAEPTESDSPTIVVTLESGGEQRRVHDYQGCQGNAELDAFRELETRIDTVAGTRARISP